MPELFSYSDIAKMIDHSLLNPTLTDKELQIMRDACPRNNRYNGVSGIS